MLIEIKDKVVSTEIFSRKFVCDLNACKGACCIEGDAGAPLSENEVKIIEDDLEAIKPYMREEGIAVVEKEGVSYLDRDDEPVTTLVNGKECAFVYFDDNGTTVTRSLTFTVANVQQLLDKTVRRGAGAVEFLRSKGWTVQVSS